MNSESGFGSTSQQTEQDDTDYASIPTDMKIGHEYDRYKVREWELLDDETFLALVADLYSLTLPCKESVLIQAHREYAKLNHPDKHPRSDKQYYHAKMSYANSIYAHARTRPGLLLDSKKRRREDTTYGPRSSKRARHNHQDEDNDSDKDLFCHEGMNTFCSKCIELHYNCCRTHIVFCKCEPCLNAKLTITQHHPGKYWDSQIGCTGTDQCTCLVCLYYTHKYLHPDTVIDLQDLM